MRKQSNFPAGRWRRKRQDLKQPLLGRFKSRGFVWWIIENSNESKLEASTKRYRDACYYLYFDLTGWWKFRNSFLIDDAIVQCKGLFEIIYVYERINLTVSDGKFCAKVWLESFPEASVQQRLFFFLIGLYLPYQEGYKHLRAWI